jgi:hypothetical protein
MAGTEACSLCEISNAKVLGGMLRRCMKHQSAIKRKSYRQPLLLVLGVCLLGFTGCSSFDASWQKFHAADAGQKFHDSLRVPY